MSPLSNLTARQGGGARHLQSTVKPAIANGPWELIGTGGVAC
jgi:hypothetical protein